MIQQSPPLVFAVYVIVFLGALLAFDGLRQLLSRGENHTEARNRRMRLIRKGASEEEILKLLRDTGLPTGGRRLGPFDLLRRLLRQSGLPLSPRLFFVLVAVLGGGLYLVLLRFVEPVLAAPGAAVLALALPLMVLSAVRQERLTKITAQLPDALELMARGLRVGHPVSVTVESVATNQPDPIGTEFGLILDQISFGDDVATAFHDFGERVGTEDARYLAVSVGIQHGTGGNLARVLDVLAKVVRDRLTMRKRIKAISSEGRLSALILTLLPVGIFLSIHLTTPSFYGDVQSDPLFRPFAVAIVGLVVVQALILRRLVTFKF